MNDKVSAILWVTHLFIVALVLGYLLGVEDAEPTPEQKEIIAKHERMLLCEEYATKAFCKEMYER